MRNRAILMAGMVCVWMIVTQVLFAHEVEVHERITEHAGVSAYDLSSGFRSFLGAFAPRTVAFGPDVVPRTPEGWMIWGSRREDDIPDMILGYPVVEFGFGDAGGRRPFNHFYDPLSGEGLSDRGPLDPVAPLGRNSFVWASSDAAGLDIFTPPRFRNVNTHNDWAWNRVRLYEQLSFTESSKADRQRNLAQMFRGLGDVLHLLQDASQPQHVRNEQHLDKIAHLEFLSPYHSPIEKYGKNNVAKLNYLHGMLDWRAASFTKAQDFWDRNFYTWNRNAPLARSPHALVESEDGTKPQKKLGLAEFVNGNFIGDRHTYREVVTKAPFHYPYPSLYEGTDWLQLKANPNANWKPTTIGSGDGKRFIVAKTGQGRTRLPNGEPWLRHGVVDYLVAWRATVQGHSYTVTLPEGIAGARVNDPDVLKDYHDILIPEAVKYSAGLLDYFFRGQLETSLAPNTSGSGGAIQLTIQNLSGQALKGGTFQLFWDNTSGTRTELTATTANGYFGNTWDPGTGSLLDNGTLVTTFTPPSGVTVDKYTLVYKGTIGIDNNNAALDSVDAGIAIAAKTFPGICGSGGSTPISGLVWSADTSTLGPSSSYLMSGGDGSYALNGHLMFDNPADWLTIGTQFCHDGPSYNATIEVDYDVDDLADFGCNAGGVFIYFDSYSTYTVSGSGTLSFPIVVTPGSHAISIYLLSGEKTQFPLQEPCLPGSNAGAIRVRPLSPP